MRSGDPGTLSAEELQLDKYPLTKDPQPSTVRAWIRYPEGSLEVEGLAVAWTSRAVAVKWEAYDDVEHRCWVWSGACERI